VHTGAQVGRYLLLECVGKGGAGVVYRALHTTLKTLVAVKFLRPDIGSGDGAAQERLAREAQLLAQLNHPNVVRVLDFEDDPVRPYVVMEFVDGLTAAELIRQSGRLSAGRAVEVALDVAAGLAAAREIGIVHRDVKPGNVLVTRSGASKLVDLGLATVTRPDLAAARPDAPPVEGTVGYMSPEALSAGLVDHRSDVYSLGATLFHLIAGRLPFTGRSAAEVVMKHLRHPPPAVHEFAPETPPQLSAFIQTMMAKDPAARPQTHQEVRAELMGLLHTLGASESAPRG
jgi:serine/threonine protein kinase